ncbi:MAG: hypothetical protein PHC37_02605 [Candidatus Omnitrophica bacterium]|jgi:hypothetical protein|nr:hypothetical protein [Candidatus Omnitrophota bacterium]MDD5690578.1 hypothetical protein [Candidatus Omnitrophota bacterium]
MMKQKAFCLRLFFIISFVLFLSETVFAEVPIPWGAKLIRDDVAVAGNGEERKIASYETKASKQELLNYYLREMPGRGYRLFMNGEQNLVFSKAEELVIVVVPSTQAGKTSFMVSTAPMKTLLGKDSSYSAGVSCEPIPSVPVYSGARCMNSTRLKSGGSRSVAYSIEEPISVVLDFYRNQMPRYGWQLEKENNLEDIMSKVTPGQQQTKITPEQQAAMRNLLGSAHGMFFANQKGNSCFVQVMNNPTNKEASIASIIYEDKTSK